jgi:hypothetical protein
MQISEVFECDLMLKEMEKSNVHPYRWKKKVHPVRNVARHDAVIQLIQLNSKS